MCLRGGDSEDPNLLGGEISDRRDAIALRLIDVNDLTLEGNAFTKAKPKAQIIGQCFCLFSKEVAIRNSSYLTII